MWSRRNPTSSQQTIQAYEAGRRRIPVSALPVVARALSASLEDLFGETGQPVRSKLRAGAEMGAANRGNRPAIEGVAALCNANSGYGAGASQPLKEEL